MSLLNGFATEFTENTGVSILSFVLSLAHRPACSVTSFPIFQAN